MIRILTRLAALLGMKNADLPELGIDLTARGLQRMLDNTCVGCGGDLVNHRYVRLGITVAAPHNHDRLCAFVDAYRDDRWDSVRSYQEFEGAHNAVECFAVSCPNERNTVLLVRNPEELFDDSSVIEKRVLLADDWSYIERLTNDLHWAPL